MAEDTKIPVSNDPSVPLATTTDPSTAVKADGTVDAQAAALAGAAKRQAREATKKGSNDIGGVVPTGGIVRQLEDGAETDRRSGIAADQSLAGENLPVLRGHEPDPRQGVTTGDLTNPGIPDAADSVEVTFNRGYHLFNRGEKASFSGEEAARLKALGVVE